MVTMRELREIIEERPRLGAGPFIFAGIIFIIGMALFILVIFQGIGLLMYMVNVWPTARLAGPGGEPISSAITALLSAAVIMGIARSFVWIKIYWDGSKALSLLRTFLP